VLSDTVRISTIDVKQDLGADVVLCKGESFAPLELHANVPSGAQVLWSNGSDDTLISATEAGDYWVMVTDSVCTGSDTLSVIEQLCNCWTDIPNAFSPNGDGLNDVFQPVIEAGCPIQNYVLDIYNRYGTRIFSGYNPGEGWNGTYSNGKPADVGVYMYTLSFEGGTNKNIYKKKGDISLVR
jgi:gliding motility-associated-like protein